MRMITYSSYSIRLVPLFLIPINTCMQKNGEGQSLASGSETVGSNGDGNFVLHISKIRSDMVINVFDIEIRP